MRKSENTERKEAICNQKFLLSLFPEFKQVLLFPKFCLSPNSFCS